MRQMRQAYLSGSLTSMMIERKADKQNEKEETVYHNKVSNHTSKLIVSTSEQQHQEEEANGHRELKPWGKKGGLFAPMTGGEEIKTPGGAGYVLVPLDAGQLDNKQMQMGCAWSVTVMASTYNVAFPDLNCVYQVKSEGFILDRRCSLTDIPPYRYCYTGV